MTAVDTPRLENCDKYRRVSLATTASAKRRYVPTTGVKPSSDKNSTAASRRSVAERRLAVGQRRRSLVCRIVSSFLVHYTYYRGSSVSIVPKLLAARTMSLGSIPNTLKNFSSPQRVRTLLENGYRGSFPDGKAAGTLS
jgi:hypothetical protein